MQKDIDSQQSLSIIKLNRIYKGGGIEDSKLNILNLTSLPLSSQSLQAVKKYCHRINDIIIRRYKLHANLTVVLDKAADQEGSGQHTFRMCAYTHGHN
jgi:hypothetical protein